MFRNEKVKLMSVMGKCLLQKIMYIWPAYSCTSVESGLKKNIHQKVENDLKLVGKMASYYL